MKPIDDQSTVYCPLCFQPMEIIEDKCVCQNDHHVAGPVVTIGYSA